MAQRTQRSIREQFDIIESQDVTDAYASNPWIKNNRVISAEIGQKIKSRIIDRGRSMGPSSHR